MAVDFILWATGLLRVKAPDCEGLLLESLKWVL